MDVQIVAVPYDLDRARAGVGAGPLRLLEAGVARALDDAGHRASVAVVDGGEPFDGPAAAVGELARRVAAAVRAATRRGAWPVVLAGNCNSAIGTLAGLGPRPVGALWFDAHGDFNTPETSPSGYLDGMGLAVATGRCLPELWAAATAEPPVADERVALAGARALDDGEAELLERSAVTVVPAGDPDAVRAAAAHVAQRSPGGVYVHLDVDALDPEVAPGVAHPAPGGLAPGAVADALAELGGRGALRALGVTAFDPSHDRDGRTAATIARLVVAAADAAES